MSHRDARHLVRPGGRDDANLLFFLLYPPFCSSQVYDGETYDPGCVSINTLIGSGFNDKNTFWVDMYCRRSNIWLGSGDDRRRFSPFTDVEKSLLVLHTNWATSLLDMAVAGILVVFGKPNRMFLSKLWGDRLKQVTLWDSNKTTFHILHGGSGQGDRLVFFLWHPEYLTQCKDPTKGKEYDKQLAVIARMSGIGQSPEQQTYQLDTSQGLRDKYPDPDGAKLSRDAKLGVLKRKLNNQKVKNGLELRADTTIDVQCHICGFLRLDITPYFLSVGGIEFYVAAKAYCPVCAEEEGKVLGDGMCRWFITTESILWVKDKPEYLNRPAEDLIQYAEWFDGPGSDNVAGLGQSVDAIIDSPNVGSTEKAHVKKPRLPKRGDKGGRRPPDYTKVRQYYYYIDPQSKERCDSSFTQLGSVKFHFIGKHPNATWDKTLVEAKVGDPEKTTASDATPNSIRQGLAPKPAPKPKVPTAKKEVITTAKAQTANTGNTLLQWLVKKSEPVIESHANTNAAAEPDDHASDDDKTQDETAASPWEIAEHGKRRRGTEIDDVETPEETTAAGQRPTTWVTNKRARN